MRRVVVLNHVTVDGVMQGPGRADEDTRGGFERGGWAAPYVDDVMGQVLQAHMAAAGGLLLGRWSYEGLLSYWNSVTDSPYVQMLNSAPKYVASHTLGEPLPWPNSTLLTGELAEAVTDLKEQPAKDLYIMGSGVLIGSLMRLGLIDEYVLMIYPLVLGSGRRLFPEGSPRAPLQLMNTMATTTGVVIATYQPAKS